MPVAMRRCGRVLLCFGVLASPSCNEEAQVTPNPQVAAHARVAPKDYKTSLEKAAADADRLVVSPTGIQNEPPLSRFELKGAPKVRELLSLIEIDVEQSGINLTAMSEFTLSFYRGEDRLVTLYPYGDAWLDWVGHWDGCAFLTPESQAAIPRWFKEQGFPDLHQAREARLAEARAQREEFERFVQCFPEPARPLLTGSAGPNDGFVAFSSTPVTPGRTTVGTSDEEVGHRLATIVGDGRKLAAASFRALGGRRTSWSQAEPEVRKVLAAVRTVGPEAFAAALQDVEDDRVALLGAARVFFCEGADERAAAPVRDQWAAVLGEVALTDGVDANKALTLARLARMEAPAARTLLRDVAAGRAGKEIDRGQVGDEPGVRAGAALALAQSGDAGIADELKRMARSAPDASDVAAAEVGLSLLGDPDTLRNEHFAIHSFVIGYAALDAIERLKGAHGLDMLVAGGLEHPWAGVKNEAVLTFERITGQDFSAKRRGLQVRSSSDDVRSWWAANGAAFVQQRRDAAAVK